MSSRGGVPSLPTATAATCSTSAWAEPPGPRATAARSSASESTRSGARASVIPSV